MASDIQKIQQTPLSQGEIILYQPDETISLEVRVDDETVWLNRKQMADLFGRDVKTIGKHVNNALREELRSFAVVAKFATTAKMSAQREIILIDNYVDATIFELLEKRGQGVKATIYTEHVGQSLQHTQQLSLQQHGREIELREHSRRFHDRFLILDDQLYHFGASFKDLGRKLFAFERMGIDKHIILSQL